MNGKTLSWTRALPALLAASISVSAAVASVAAATPARRPAPPASPAPADAPPRPPAPTRAADAAQPQPDPLAPPANGPRKADPTWHALTNATVYTEPGKKLEHATIVIRGGKIVSVEGTPAPVTPGELLGKPDDKKDAPDAVKSDSPVPAASPTPDSAKTDSPASPTPDANKKDPASTPAEDKTMSPAPPPGARVWDCRGLTIYAGWIDPYIEVETPLPAPDAPGQHWNGRVTPQRSALDGKGLDAGAMESLRRMGYVAAAISPRGGIFRGSAAVVSLAKPEDDRQLSRPPIYEEKAYQSVAFETGGRRGGDEGGNTNSNWSSYPDSQMGAIALIRQTLIDADWWRDTASTRHADDSSQADAPSALDSLVFNPDVPLSRGSALLFDTSDELEVFRAVKIADEFRRPQIILGCGTEFRRIDGIAQTLLERVNRGGVNARRNTSLIIPLNFPEPPKVGLLGQADAVELRDLMTWEQAPTNPRRLEAAGLTVALTTSKLRDKGKFTENLRKAIRYGLSDDAALAMVTTRPAALLGVSKQLGTVEAGKVASLVVADGAIFGKKTKIRDVWVDGKRYEISPPPATSLKGEWAVTLDPAPPQAEGVTAMRLTFSIDKETPPSITIRKFTTKDGLETMAKQTARNVRVEGTHGAGRLSFIFDHDPFGEPGVFINAGVIEDQGKTIHADATRANGARFKWTAKKIADEPVSEADATPKGFAGTWIYTEADGNPVPAQAVAEGLVPTIIIDKDNNLTVKLKDKEVKAESVKVEGKTITIIIKGEPLGEAGTLTSTGALDGDSITGETKYEDGRKQTWKLSRQKKEAEKPSDKKTNGKPGDAALSSFAGTWIFTTSGGNPVPKEAVESGLVPTIVIDNDTASITIKRKDKEVKAESVQAKGKSIAFTVKGELSGPLGASTSTGTLDRDTITGETRYEDGRVETWTLSRQKNEPEQPADKKDAPKDDAAKPGDPVSGTWSGTALAEGMPQGLPITLTLKLGDNNVVTGAAVAMGESSTVENGTFTKSSETSGKLKFTITPPQGPPIAVGLDIAANAATGGGQSGATRITLNLTRAAASSASGASSDDDEVPTDIPDKITYPFGPYAMDTGLPPVESVLFINATIWTSGPQGVIHGGYLLIENGVIKAIGPGKSDAAAGTRVIDCAGKHITPGLIDCHSHTGISRGVNESGQAVTAEVRIQDVTDPDAMSWYYQLAGGITTVNNLHGSANPIGGQNCVNKNRWGVLKPDDLHYAGAIPGIKFALGENVKQSNWGDGATTRYPKTRMGVETLIRDRFTAAREYLQARKGKTPIPGGSSVEFDPAKNVQRPDLELEALGEILEGKRLIHCHSYRQDEILMLCRVADDFGFKLGTFQHILEGYKVANEVRDHSIGPSAFSDWWAYKVEVQDAIPYAGAIMHDVGAIVSFNSDSDELARRMNVEAGKAVKYGNIAPDEALKFVTLNPAKQLKIDDKVGSLEVGKSADLAIWSVPAASSSTPPGDAAKAEHFTVEGTPMSVFARCEQTWVDGRQYFSAERDQQMREANAKTRSRLIQKLLATGPKKTDGAKPGEGSPTPGGAAPGRRRRPTDDLTAGAAAFDNSFDDNFNNATSSSDEPDTSVSYNAADTADPSSTPRRSSLMDRMARQAAEARREHYLQLWRRGIDPTWSRCGDCGESFGTR